MAGINRETLRNFIERDRLTAEDKKQIQAVLYDDEDVYLQLRMCRDMLLEQIIEMIESDRSDTETLLSIREKRKQFNWIQHTIERHDGTGDRNPFDELAAAWTAACERAAEK